MDFLTCLNRKHDLTIVMITNEVNIAAGAGCNIAFRDSHTMSGNHKVEPYAPMIWENVCLALPLSSDATRCAHSLRWWAT